MQVDLATQQECITGLRRALRDYYAEDPIDGKAFEEALVRYTKAYGRDTLAFDLFDRLAIQAERDGDLEELKFWRGYQLWWLDMAGYVVRKKVLNYNRLDFTKEVMEQHPTLFTGVFSAGLLIGMVMVLLARR